MKNIVNTFFITCLLVACGESDKNAVSSSAGVGQKNQLAKFEPPDGKVLVFVGQDNKSVGGTEKYANGY